MEIFGNFLLKRETFPNKMAKWVKKEMLKWSKNLSKETKIITSRKVDIFLIQNFLLDETLTCKNKQHDRNP